MGGFAADDVEQIEIVMPSGEVERAALIENAFYWEGSMDEAKPETIRIIRRGKQIAEPWPSAP